MTESFIEQLPDTVRALWKAKGFAEPTKIQIASFQPLEKGENAFILSPTGSGKTLAYLLPLFQSIKVGSPYQLMILLPSQELAVQVGQIAKEWSKAFDLTSVTLVGGGNIKRQIEQLKTKPEIVVGTPGRILELVKQRKIKGHLVEKIILDEADQFLQEADRNFIRTLFATLPKTMQVVLASATKQATLKQEFLPADISIIEVADPDLQAQRIDGFIEVLPRKRGELLRKMGNIPEFRALVFFHEVKEMGAIAEKLQYEGIKVATLASDQTKLERKLALKAFATGQVTFLLTTDVLARGIDFQAIPYVVQYDLAHNKEQYIHRAGRTARMGEKGCVLTFVAPNQMNSLNKLSETLDLSLQPFYVYSGQLLDQTAYEELSQEKVAQETAIRSTKTEVKEKAKKSKSIAQPEASQPFKEAKRKKKKRHKHEKNKGKPRKK